jgi:hypothetical protein
MSVLIAQRADHKASATILAGRLTMPQLELINGVPSSVGMTPDNPFTFDRTQDVSVQVSFADDRVLIWYNDPLGEDPGKAIGNSVLSNWQPVNLSLRNQSQPGSNHLRIRVWNIGGDGNNNSGIIFKIVVTNLAGAALPQDPLVSIRDVGHDTSNGYVRDYHYWFKFEGR